MTIDTSQFKKLVDVAKKTIQVDVVDPAAVYFHDITPIRSGNARRSTYLRKTTISAEYPYAERLDEGYSKQAPKGMTTPTEKEVQRLVDVFVRKLGK
jgi:hypothetical protein